MSMTENEAKGFIQGKLDCMNKCDVFDCKNTDECDGCKYCYSQGNFGEQKKAFELAIQALEIVAKMYEHCEGSCTDCPYWNPKFDKCMNDLLKGE